MLKPALSDIFHQGKSSHQPSFLTFQDEAAACFQDAGERAMNLMDFLTFFPKLLPYLYVQQGVEVGLYVLKGVTVEYIILSNQKSIWKPFFLIVL